MGRIHDEVYDIPVDVFQRRVPVGRVDHVVSGRNFEWALAQIRRHVSVRRTGWLSTSRLVRAGNDVFVLFGTKPKLSRSPDVWKPYPEDFLATDWVLA